MTCFFGHRWSKWEKTASPPQKYSDGERFRYLAQRRHCLRCNYHTVEWLKECEYLDDEPETPVSSNDGEQK